MEVSYYFNHLRDSLIYFVLQQFPLLQNWKFVKIRKKKYNIWILQFLLLRKKFIVLKQTFYRIVKESVDLTDNGQ